MGSDDEGLLDVGGFGGAGDEDAEAGTLEAQALIGVLHGVDDLVGGQDEDEVLGDDEDGAMRAEAAAGNPYRAVLGDAELAGKDGEIDALQLMRALHGRDVDVGRSGARDERDDLARLGVEREAAEFGLDGGEVGDADEAGLRPR